MKRGLSAAEQQALATGRYSQLDAKDEEVTEVLPSKVPDEAAAVVDTNKQEQTKQRAKRDALATGEDKARFEKDVAQSVFFERGEHAEKVNEVAFSRRHDARDGVGRPHGDAARRAQPQGEADADAVKLGEGDARRVLGKRPHRRRSESARS